MVAILSEHPLPRFALVVFLRRSPGDQLHTVRNHLRAGVFDEKMNVIRCDDVVEHAQTEALLRFKEPMQIAAPITCKVE